MAIKIKNTMTAEVKTAQEKKIFFLLFDQGAIFSSCTWPYKVYSQP